MYYAAHNNTKYYLIASYFLGKSTNSRTRQKIQQSLMKYKKIQNQSGTKQLNETLQDQLNESILLKKD